MNAHNWFLGQNNVATPKKKGIVSWKGASGSNLRNTGNNEGKDLPDYGEASFVLNKPCRLMTRIEQNITSSDIEFLDGKDSVKKSKATMIVKDKPENTPASCDDALTTADLSGLKHKASEDVDMNDDIMSVAWSNNW